LNYIFLAPVPEEAATTNTVIKITHKNSRTNITCTKGRQYTVLQNQYASKNVKNVFWPLENICYYKWNSFHIKEPISSWPVQWIPKIFCHYIIIIIIITIIYLQQYYYIVRSNIGNTNAKHEERNLSFPK
jgi:hypothetical protein